MSELFHQLGIDWKLLLSQGVNFMILLSVLTYFLWKPLIKIIEERRKKIELGLEVGEKAAKKLAEIDEVKIRTLASAESRALLILKKGEDDAKASGTKITDDARSRADIILQEAADTVERKAAEANLSLMQEAKNLVRAAIIKTVGLEPKAVDEALVERALAEIKKARSGAAGQVKA